jgi:hypothetical protein
MPPLQHIGTGAGDERLRILLLSSVFSQSEKETI